MYRLCRDGGKKWGMTLSSVRLMDERTARLGSTGRDAGELILRSKQAGRCAAPGAPVGAHHQPLGCLFRPRQLGSQPAQALESSPQLL